MNPKVQHTLEIRVIDEDENIVLAHQSSDHTRDGACAAYGHAIAALMKHYKEKREDELALIAAREEAARVKNGTN